MLCAVTLLPGSLLNISKTSGLHEGGFHCGNSGEGPRNLIQPLEVLDQTVGKVDVSVLVASIGIQ